MSVWQGHARLAAERLWDVAVVGGGPAGAIAALYLARGGCSVLIIERDAYPRDKTCGDALIADSIRVLDRAGLLPRIEQRAFETTSLRLYSPSQIEVEIPSRTLLIKRIELDEYLARAAADAGAVVVQGVIERIDAGEVARLLVRGLDRPVRARIAIIATGADIRLLTGLEMVERAQPSVVAVRRYVRSSVKINHLVFSFDRTIVPGYVWLFPLPDGEYNVGCGAAYGARRVNLAETLDRFIRTFEPLRAFAEGITHQEPVKGAVLRSGLTGTSPWRPPNILAIGESIGTTFPFTGEGIGKAMESGELAAAVVLRTLAAGDLSLLGSFVGEMSALRHRYRGYEAAEKWLARPWLADLVTRVARRSRYAISSAEAVMNETADPRDIFSVRGLWKMIRS